MVTTTRIKSHIVGYFVRTLSGTAMVAIIAKVKPLARVARNVVRVGERIVLPFITKNKLKQARAPIGSLTKFAGGKMELEITIERTPATIPMASATWILGEMRMIARQ